MLRNHCGWAGRRFVAFLLLTFLTCPVAWGVPIIGVPPVVPPRPVPTPPGYQAPTTYEISGYVYDDVQRDGVKSITDPGLSAVQIVLDAYSPTTGALLTSSTAMSNAMGSYMFSGLTPGDIYSLQEIQPYNMGSTLDSVGNFVTATGVTMPGSGTATPPDEITGIVMPMPTGAFAPTSKGVYTAVNYDFGNFPKVALPPPPGGGGGSLPTLRPP